MINEDIRKTLSGFDRLKIGIIGDFCLDVYWHLNEELSEKSVETGLMTRPVCLQEYFLGGAGNVAANIAALGAGRVSLFGVIGEDPFGVKMKSIAADSQMNTDGLLTQLIDWSTHVYIKPVITGNEENRIDFGNANCLDSETASSLLKHIEKTVPDLDLIIINQQVPSGIHTEAFRQGLNKIIASFPAKKFIIDSRDLSEEYPLCLHKMNDIEAARLGGLNFSPGDEVPLKDLLTVSKKLSEKWKNPFFITRGDRGCLVVENSRTELMPSVLLSDPIDTVGAGDAMLAGISMALANGKNSQEAAALGNLTAAVCIKKLHCTGTASQAEILKLASDVNYVLNPDKAAVTRNLSYYKNSEIELIDAIDPGIEIRHIIFDHDGTLSVLREGWEEVMEPVMMEAILGSADTDEVLYARVLKRVKKFIDDSTGIQTLVQMQGLVRLVREFGFVNDAEILDEHGYKKIYNDALMKLIVKRVEKIEKGELTPCDYAVKGAPEFLELCHSQGIKLYLASGTDEEDVISEAEAMGYADLFEGRIYGAIGDVTKEAKRIVMDRIINDIGPGNTSKMMAIGDGPVEIREMRKRGGLAIGIASDELRRFGLNPAKRRRLIRAGAHAVIADYSQMEQLCSLLNLDRSLACHTHS